MQSLARRLEPGGALSCAGISAPAQPFFAALLQRIFPSRPLVVVTDNLKAQENFQQDLETWMQNDLQPPPSGSRLSTLNSQLLFYPAWEILPHEGKLPHADIISERLQALLTLAAQSQISNPKAQIVVTNVAALLQKTFAPGELKSRTRALNRGDRADPLDLVEWLEAQGYEPEAQVSQKGEIALRGGILDVFPPTSPWPVRFEFFGDELESLRHFDPLTQISREEITSIALPPAGELGILKSGIPKPDSEPSTLNSVKERGSHGASRFQLSTLLDYLPRETIFLFCDPEQLAVRADEYAQQIPAGDPFFVSWKQFCDEVQVRGMAQLELNEADEIWSSGFSRPQPPHDETPTPLTGAPVCDPARWMSDTADRAGPETGAPIFSSLDAFRPVGERAPDPQIAELQRREFFNQLHRWLRQGFAVHVFCNNDGERQRFTEIWVEHGLGDAGQASRFSDPVGQDARRLTSKKQNGIKPTRVLSYTKEGDRQNADPTLRIGNLSRGFLCDQARLVVITDAEIFGRYKVQRPRRLKSAHAQSTRSALDIDFAELEEGDFVVHLQCGIGRYLGLKNMPVGLGNRESAIGNRQSETECLVIEYAPTDSANEPPKLYVPVSEAHLVSKYVGVGKVRPPLNALGGTRWKKAKEQAEHAVRDVAAELLRIQAARQSQAGMACQPDTPWQREFESAFIYEETPDQLRAILETKADMERPKPMDRLICGDVGFGKTEVAIRAAFKAVMDGKQAAVLVPTTVLAQQHFNNFRERMAQYPVRIELLSRFRTRGEQQRVVKDLAAGAVDIVIGTHRLVQDDIVFKDLGLVVIDEEQRFGVLHKEKFKRLRTLVDVLTLSATPIPRTLYLALTGARDMSTIQTPPHDRLPVETIVSQYDERVIRDAIQRELNRGGQVFFLHNRVMTIETMRAKLETLVPHARIVVGHGQMNADDLEEVMTQFVNGQSDVLLSTTIIESGLDIPNANTIIIDRADRFGLSDLYQLRGRVGRYKHQAYAYLLLPRHAHLLMDVRKRISAIKQYSTLGSGFKIAMRDLEIRGAGNLLGSEQSGHITAVGFELYCQLLKQSIGALKGEKVKPRMKIEFRLDFIATNPAESESVTPLTLMLSPPDGEREESRAAEDQRSVRHSPAPREGSSLSRPNGERAGVGGAYLPHHYVPEPQHRIEIYRKLAQAADKAALDGLQKELRDRFGPLPPPVELLLTVAELKILAGEKSVSVIEVKEGKLMITRHGDLITLGGKFPRLTKKDAKARLKEIKKLLLAL